MTQYYNQYHISVLVFNLGNKIYLDSVNIHTTHSSTRLFYWCLRSYIVKKQVGPISYRLKLFLSIRRLHPVFHVVKLTAATEDPIPE